MQRLRVFLAALTVGGFSLPVTAAWSSGGGELIQDANNPWFVKNTKMVTYCVTTDKVNFGLPIDTAKVRIAEAIDFWKDEITGARAATKPSAKNPLEYDTLESGSLGIGTQQFVLGECRPETDLRFQLGVLSPEQHHKMGDVSRTVSIAVRTEYDSVQLRGKGFIYVAPEKGELSLGGDYVVPNSWSYKDGQRLKLVLEHELGHVFGVAHNESNMMMSQHFPENVVDKYWASLFEGKLPHVFSLISTSTVACDDHRRLDRAKFFNLPEGWQCRRLDMSSDGFTLYGRKLKGQGAWVRLGSATSARVEVATGAVCTYLPREQRVFDAKNSDPLAWPVREVCGSYINRERTTGIYTSTDAKTSRTYFADLAPGGYQINGLKDGQLVFDVASDKDQDREHSKS